MTEQTNETHSVCNTALKLYGGKATCCYCSPLKHDCDFMTKQTPKLEELIDEFRKQFINDHNTKWRPLRGLWWEDIQDFIKKVYEAERDKYELRYCPHCNRMVNSQKATELFNAGYETGKPTEKNISQLRTWINEKPKDRLVTNEDIKMWLEM